MANDEIERETERVLTDASKASVWVPWYFKRGVLTLVIAPLFLLLCYCIVISVFGAVIQAWRCSDQATRSSALSAGLL